MLQCIPKIIIRDYNDQMERLPIKEKVNKVVLALNGESASASDDFSRQFLQKCWDIIEEDITNMVKSFCYG